MVLVHPIRRNEFADGQLEEWWVFSIRVEAKLSVGRIPRLSQQRLLDAHAAPNRAAPTVCDQLVATQMGDHPPSALRDVRLVGGWSMSAQDREQSVFARLRQV